MNLTPEQMQKCGPDHPIMQVIERLSAIEDKMAKQDPEISGHLKAIWKHLQQYEELAHLLTPEQIGTLMRGMQKHTAVSLVVESKSKGGTRGKKPTVADLI